MRESSYLFRQLVALATCVATPLIALQAYNLHEQSRQTSEAAAQAVANYASSVAHDAQTLVADTKQYLAFLSLRPLIRALDGQKCDPILEGVTSRRRHIADVLLVDAQGHVVCAALGSSGSTPDALAGFDWWQRAAASDSLVMSKPFAAPLAQPIVLAISAPLRGAQGHRIGTLAVLVNLESLQSQWARYALPPNSRISLFDADGTIIVTRPDFPTLTGKDASATIRNARKNNPGDAGIAPGIDGISRAFAIRPVPAVDWQAVVAIPTEHVFGPSSLQLRRSLATMAIVILATFVFVYAMAKRLSRPLEELAEVARAVGGGQTDCRASEDVPGEFKVVAREFNSMLEASLRHLDFYRALSRTNGAIVRTKNVQSLYDEICRVCVEHGHASVAYISLAKGAIMDHVAWAGPAEALIRGLSVQPGHAEVAGTGLSGLAVGTGTRQISNDVARDGREELWRDLLDAIGTKSIAACPFRQGGVTVGALTLHMTVPGFFDARVTALLDEMTEDISFALDNFARNDELARQDKRLAALVDTAMDAIISVDASHKICLFNRAACQMFGIEQTEALGTSVERFVPSTLRSAHESHLRTFARAGSTARRMGGYDLFALRADGHQFPIDASISKMGEGETALMTVVIRDTTELKAAQQSIVAQAAAESANRAKTEFLSRMSHELRTPLNAVLGFAQLLQDCTIEPLTPTQQGHVEQVRVAGWHLLAVINDVLDVSKIEGGHVAVKDQAVDLDEVIDEAIRIIAPAVQSAGIRVLKIFDQSAPTSVQADPQRLRQVMINLLSNATKYNVRGGAVEVRVSGDVKETYVDVIDTGMGMTPAQLEHLFEPFNRLGRERGGIEGTGLGLTLARHLTELMGGRLEVHSELGVGTKARTTLRTSRGVDQGGSRSGRVEEGKAGTPTGVDELVAGTVLYIEDNAINFMLVEQLLHRWPSVRLLHAQTGRDGVGLALSVSVDLILLDMRLPDLDGLQVLAELRQHKETQHVRVVALSASAMAEDVDAARNAGVLDYWTKPLVFSEFLQNIQTLLATK